MIAENFATGVAGARQRQRQALRLSSKPPTSRSSGTTSGLQGAGVEPPKTWAQLLAAAKTMKASGMPAYSIGGADGWTLTDLFENIYLRTAGHDEVRPADCAQDQVDGPVGEARR